MNVLIADDHELFRQALMLLFQSIRKDAAFHEAGSLSEAWQACGETQFDLVLLDLGLPDFESIDQVAELRNGVGDAKFVIVSGSDRVENMRAAIKIGAHGYLPKSDTSSMTVKALDLILSGGTYFPKEAFELEPESAPSAPTDREAQEHKSLTERQKELLKLLGEGLPNGEIAYRLDITEGTVRVHISNLLKRLGVSTRIQAALMARDIFEEG